MPGMVLRWFDSCAGHKLTFKVNFMGIYIRHIVSEMKNDLTQRCIICGEVINDYSKGMWPIEQGPPSGFRPGEIFTDGFCTTLGIDDSVEFKNCE